MFRALTPMTCDGMASSLPLSPSFPFCRTGRMTPTCRLCSRRDEVHGGQHATGAPGRQKHGCLQSTGNLHQYRALLVWRLGLCHVLGRGDVGILPGESSCTWPKWTLTICYSALTIVTWGLVCPPQGPVNQAGDTPSGAWFSITLYRDTAMTQGTPSGKWGSPIGQHWNTRILRWSLAVGSPTPQQSL